MAAPTLSNRAWYGLALLLVTGFLIYLLAPILMPFLVAAALAYLGDPVADRLEEWGLSRTLAVTVVFTALILLVAGALLLLLPQIGAQLDYLRQQLPGLIDWLQTTVLPWLSREFDVDPAVVDLEKVKAALAGNWQSTGNFAATLLKQTTQSSLALMSWLANLALIPVVTFYLLRDWDVLVARVRDLLPRDVQPMAVKLADECDEVLGAFIRGQLLVMLCLGVIYASGLWLVGLKLGLLIGIIAGIANIVPYLGFIVGIGAALIAAVFQFNDPLLPMLMIGGVFLVGQLLEGMVLTPILVGDKIGLHPVAVIFAILAGGQLFGFVGVLIALPVAAVVMVLLRHAHDRYLQSALYGRSPPEEAAEGAESDEVPR